jgi:hypothetical protein
MACTSKTRLPNPCHAHMHDDDPRFLAPDFSRTVQIDNRTSTHAHLHPPDKSETVDTCICTEPKDSTPSLHHVSMYPVPAIYSGNFTGRTVRIRSWVKKKKKKALSPPTNLEKSAGDPMAIQLFRTGRSLYISTVPWKGATATGLDIR